MEYYGVPRPRELDVQGVYRVGPDPRSPELLVDDFEAPNGQDLAVCVIEARTGQSRSVLIAPGRTGAGHAEDNGGEPVSAQARKPQAGQDGFTLIEALIAMVVLVFGLIAVSNLLVVAGTSNKVAADSTAAANVAQQQLELLRSTTYDTLRLQAGAGDPTATQNVPGVGDVQLTWTVEELQPQLLFITLRAESNNPIARARSRAQYTVFRACTDVSRGCPAAP